MTQPEIPAEELALRLSGNFAPIVEEWTEQTPLFQNADAG
jgi:hypothetical protein